MGRSSSAVRIKTKIREGRVVESGIFFSLFQGLCVQMSFCFAHLSFSPASLYTTLICPFNFQSTVTILSPHNAATVLIDLPQIYDKLISVQLRCCFHSHVIDTSGTITGALSSVASRGDTPFFG